MKYFNQEFVDFFKDLAANNDREWFHANKKVYESEVKKPFYRLIDDLITELGKKEGTLGIQVKDAVFRINRDIRFSSDKSPYKLHVGGVVSKGGRKNVQIPGLYIQLSAEEHYIGGGSYMPDKENLTKIRQALVDDIAGFRSAISAEKFKSYFPEGLNGEKNKILPKEFKPYQEEIPELFLKQYHSMAKIEGSDFILRDDLLESILQHYDAIRELNEFIKVAIKVD